jgi:lysosomal-trafficking regulator
VSVSGNSLQQQAFDWPVSLTQHESSSTPNIFEHNHRHSQLSTPSPSPLLISWSTIVEEKCLEYHNSLKQTIETIEKRCQIAQKSSLDTFTKVTIHSITTRAMEITQDVINFQGLERKKFLEHLRQIQSIDLRTKHLWHQLISQLTHEYGIWFESASYPKFWQLDPTENPQRERRRLQRSYSLMAKRFFENHIPDEILVNPPLSYLFDTRHYQSPNSHMSLYRNEKIDYQCRCTNVTLNSEINGELLVGIQRIYFVADEQLSTLTTTKSTNSVMTAIGYNHHSFNDDSNSFSFTIDDICEMHKRRYMLKDVAIELFLINGITWMIAHATTHDRDNLYRLLTKRGLVHYRHEETLNDIQTSWKQGQITNFEYLMQLNKLAGRTYLGK